MSLKVHELQPLLEPVGYNKIYSEFLNEAYLFADLLDAVDSSQLLKDFGDFNRYIKKRSRGITANTKVVELSGGSNVLNTVNAKGEFRTLLAYMQAATCCELFNGWSFDFQGDMKGAFSRFLERYLSHLKSGDKQSINDIYLRIATADTVRIMTLLKLLGLLPPDTSKKRVLSFGAASGVKELYATHTEPTIESHIDNLQANRIKLKFSRLLKWPKQTVLIDYDAFWQEHYRNIEATHQANVLGILSEFDVAIRDMPAILNDKKMELADLVFGWRIDHQVIPDVPEFFRSLLPSLSSKSKIDFVITIGAGDDDDDFAGRVRTMDEIWKFLKEYNLNPVRVILYNEDRDHPLFGHGSYATYEVIYCRINKKHMKMFDR